MPWLVHTLLERLVLSVAAVAVLGTQYLIQGYWTIFLSHIPMSAVSWWKIR